MKRTRKNKEDSHIGLRGCSKGARLLRKFRDAEEKRLGLELTFDQALQRIFALLKGE